MINEEMTERDYSHQSLASPRFNNLDVSSPLNENSQCCPEAGIFVKRFGKCVSLVNAANEVCDIDGERVVSVRMFVVNQTLTISLTTYVKFTQA